MIRRPPRSTQGRSSAASDVYKRQAQDKGYVETILGRRRPIPDINSGVLQQRNWHGRSAVQRAQVYCSPDEWLNTPAPSLLYGLRALAGILHPEVFAAPSNVRRLASPPAI